MTNKTDGERLERVEVNLETLTKLVEGLTKSQETMNKTLQEIKEAQIVASGTTASKEYVDTKVAIVETKLETAKKRTSFQTWVTGSLSAVFGAVLSLLIAYFISTVGR